MSLSQFSAFEDVDVCSRESFVVYQIAFKTRRSIHDSEELHNFGHLLFDDFSLFIEL